MNKLSAGNELPEIGKISPEIFEEIIYPRLGRRDPAVLVPPQHGVDIGVVDIGGGNVMAVTCDPVFVVPQYGWERSAWFAVHILASDAAVSGLAPRWMTIDLNLPLGITKDQFVTLWRAMSAEDPDRIHLYLARHEGRVLAATTLVRVGRLAGFGDLQQRHVSGKWESLF